MSVCELCVHVYVCMHACNVMYTHLWPVWFEFMTSLGVLQSLSEPAHTSVSCRAVAEEYVIVLVESDGLRVAVNGLLEVTFI